ncbi:YraN family protein [bacterium]|nr:YraN family protein [bacterium]
MVRDRLGPLAEEIAARFLEIGGARILERGYRHLGKEIDIIAWDGSRVLFVEVKGRRGDRRGTPAASVTRVKRQHIRAAARGYLSERRGRGVHVRFDVIEIVICGGGLDMTLRYIPGAFREA